MTENEAKEVLEEKYLTMSMCGDIEWCKRNNQAISKSIKALEEIQQYRAIGTVEECREAMERRKAKKVYSKDGKLSHCEADRALSSELPDKGNKTKKQTLQRELKRRKVEI